MPEIRPESNRVRRTGGALRLRSLAFRRRLRDTVRPDVLLRMTVRDVRGRLLSARRGIRLGESIDAARVGLRTRLAPRVVVARVGRLADGARDLRSPRGSGRRRRSGVLLVVLLVAALTGGVLLSAVHGSAESRAAAAQAARYVPSDAGLATALPIVALIGEGGLRAPGPTKGTPSVPWQQRTASDLRFRLDDAGSRATGFTSADKTSFQHTVSDVPRNASVVIFFAGPADLRASSLNLLKVSTAAVAAARTRAPRARVLIIGPPLTTFRASTGLLRERTTLEQAASITAARFGDPIAGRWLAEPGLLDASGRLTDAGERAVAVRMQTALAPLL